MMTPTTIRGRRITIVFWNVFFKNETKTRGKADQFHQAVRQVRTKVQEINKLFEYVSRLKSELSEGEGGLKYKLHTERALGKIKEMVAELNQNIKKFKDYRK